MNSAKFKFTPIGRKTCKALEDKNNQEYLMKWSMKGHLKVKYYNFNEPFYVHETQGFVDSFFTCSAVTTTLEAFNFDTNTWNPIGRKASKVIYECVPCTITSMEFFKRLEDPSHKIVINSNLVHCLEESSNQFEGFYISNRLQGMLLEKHENDLYSNSEKEQFIFKLFKHFVLGGKWCQYEDKLTPYLDITKSIYKDLISVERFEKQQNLFVRSIVLKCTTFDENGTSICPTKPEHLQNFMYLIIDPFKRQLAVLYGQYTDMFIS